MCVYIYIYIYIYIKSAKECDHILYRIVLQEKHRNCTKGSEFYIYYTMLALFIDLNPDHY